MEFLLPVALKLFPNMLPSTFEGQLAKVSDSLQQSLWPPVQPTGPKNFGATPQKFVRR